MRIGGNDSAVIGGNGAAYTNANLTAAINAIPGFAGTATVTGAASTGFTVTYTGASAGTDVPNLAVRQPQLRRLLRLGRGDEPRRRERLVHARLQRQHLGPDRQRHELHGGRDPGGADPILPAGATATVAGFGGGAFNNTGFQVTFSGTSPPRTSRSPSRCTSFSAGASGFVGETDKGGAVDNKGGTVTPTGERIPVGDRAGEYTIPLRTPFALTGRATDPDGDPLSTAGSRTTAAARPAPRC